MKLIIAGGRKFNDYNLLCEYMGKVKSHITEIISGGAKGADKLGERYATEKHIKLVIFPANWELYGKSAGYKRNQQMAAYGDCLLAFWDSESKGTKHMIDIATNEGLKIWVIKYES